MFPFRKLHAQCSFFLLKPCQNPRLQSTKSATKFAGKATLKEAQAALLEYLHSTRSLNFLDADNMCRNSPSFIQDLLAKTHLHTPHVNTKRSISRYLRYHPINEFEPFFESAGLSPSEYAPLLPSHMIYLNDDVVLMENHKALCNFGVPRTKMGRVFKLAPQVFRYKPGILISKLQEYENLGVSRKTLINVVASNPCILVGGVDFDFVKVVEMLKSVIGKDCDWIGEHLLINKGCCNWRVMFHVLTLLSRVFNEKQLDDLITSSPGLIFEESGGCALSLIGFLLKFGLSVNRVCVMLHEFPEIRVVKFLSNLRLCFLFLTEIEMEASEIGRILQSHCLVLGSFTIKRTITLLTNLNVGKKRLCKVVKDDPLVMKSWALGRRIEPLVNSYLECESKALKKEFMLSLGYEENSKAMNESIKLFRGRGAELQERLDFIVNAGLDYEVVCKMIRESPRILSQTTDRINMKIESLVNEGYAMSDLASFPSFLSYSAQRVKLRFSMYNWLKKHGAAEAGLALSTIIACSDKAFEKMYVNRHPSGLQVWRDLKAQISSMA
ncbi:transcription termination factor MTEF18, mitochondrial-like [Vigna umbellata]|uniref:transcription termination factor MTEF18, mitochondrial-like n=1 Tax=Vigna umbellata TaxID=87088 RepID=UPI001F5FBAB7|nr:transcription termination factor MTEF18, mitochondrial-like [Vigna umbellata]